MTDDRPPDLTTMIKIIDSFARTQDDITNVATEYYRMLFHLVDVDRPLEYPFMDPQTRHEECKNRWNCLRSTLLEASPGSDASIYPTFDDALRIATTEFVGELGTKIAIRFLQEEYAIHATICVMRSPKSSITERR